MNKNYNVSGTVLDSYSYTYDANGNLTSNGTKTFMYNEINQLTQVKTSGGVVIASYTYDDCGKRISTNVSGSIANFHYLEGSIQVVTFLNGYVSTVRFFVRACSVINLDIFRGTSPKIIGHLIDLSKSSKRF